MRTRWPIFIVSKGRWSRSLTARHLIRMGVPFRVIVEESELQLYSDALGRERLLVLDPAYKERYDTCDDLGDARTKGSGAARNFAWDTAEAEGAAWHWTMDDNIDGFYRLNRNSLVRLADGSTIRAMEDFADRYENVGMAGPNYYMFVPRRERQTPFYLNTRIYSCNLIRTDAPYRWRGRYNEDTDLSLRMLKDGWCTVLFNAFPQNKLRTATVAGGNEELYAIGTLPKSEMIAKLHPDVARVMWRYGRWHHFVNYDAFAGNRLRLREDAEIPDKTYDYGMVVEQRVGDRWVRVGAIPVADEWSDI